ncbi:histidine decarboxylase [Actinoplanes sp. ATCC 53533]|uniref:pyridoxal-dependent decarboxylase n=1 Tax=Actinoplanes sp. ATCC 53533 TaxID=1288362 RepID=UPI000F78D5F5|nr:pyridoxal-dependent decarboxylase [Actinoplanes sp. ATCC 53533]RSM59568.1 histidine decarboxylase [Actinoplanes sp. ATCC 53533]
MITRPDPATLDEAASLLTGWPVDVDTVLDGLLTRRQAANDRNIFFPMAVDIDWSRFKNFWGQLWNNIGSKDSNPPGGIDTKPAERALLAWAADLFGLPTNDWWGNLTTGGHDGNRAGLLTGRNCFPTTNPAVAYYSTSAHYSIPKLLHELAIPAVAVRADEYGEMDYADLARVLRPGSPAIIVATAGTTLTEAVDNPATITAVLDAAGITDRYLHVDAALSGVPLALDGSLWTDGVDSFAVSVHKFFGVPHTGGLIVGRGKARRRQQHIAYIASIDDSTNGSIDGLPALMTWYAVATYGNDGHRARARNARDIAAYATDQLTAIGWPAWRHPHAFTVVFPAPPAPIRDTWPVACNTDTTDDDEYHLICMPGVTHQQVDVFVQAVATALATRIPHPNPPTRHTRRPLPRPANGRDQGPGPHQHGRDQMTKGTLP